MKVLGEAVLAKFCRKHAPSRKPLARFLEIVTAAEWEHFPGLRETFPSADYTPESGKIIFNIGGNKYRLEASIEFEEQMFLIEGVLTHEEYDRETY